MLLVQIFSLFFFFYMYVLYMQWAVGCPTKIYVNEKPQNVTFANSLKRCNQLRRYLDRIGWALNPVTGILQEKTQGNEATRPPPVTGVMWLQAKEHQGLASNHQMLGEAWNGSSCRASGSGYPASTLIFGLLASITVREQVSVLSHPVCGHMSWQPQETNTLSY